MKEKMQNFFKKVANKAGSDNEVSTLHAVAGFGTQSERFKKPEHAELPPPGAYDISKSFELLKTKGRIPNAALASLTDRVLFKRIFYFMFSH